jgi:ABC-type transporter Mla subunit MlaD
MDAHTARQDEILAHHSTMLDRLDDRTRSHTEAMRDIAAILARVDDRGRQHTDAMLQISANMTRLHDSLDRSMQRLETQQTQLGEILGGMAAMLARMDEHTTIIAQILSQFQQGRNGHPE